MKVNRPAGWRPPDAATRLLTAIMSPPKTRPDEHDRIGTQRQLADIVAGALL